MHRLVLALTFVSAPPGCSAPAGTPDPVTDDAGRAVAPRPSDDPFVAFLRLGGDGVFADQPDIAVRARRGR